MLILARRQFLSLQLDGIDELIEMFENMEEAALNALDKAAEEGCKPVLVSAKNYVKVQSGDLKNSLSIMKLKTRNKKKRFYKVYSRGVRQGGVTYGFAQETGTEKMSSNPFLRPAFDNNKQKIANIMVEELGKAIIEGGS